MKESVFSSHYVGSRDETAENCQAWQQALVPTEPSRQPFFVFLAPESYRGAPSSKLAMRRELDTGRRLETPFTQLTNSIEVSGKGEGQITQRI